MDAPEAQAVAVTRTRDDYFKFSRQVARELRNVRLYYYVALAVLVIVYLNAVELAFRKRLLPDVLMNPEWWYIDAALSVAVIICLQLLLQKWFMPMLRREYLNENQNFLRPKQMAIDASGIRETSEVSNSLTLWKGVDRVQKTKDYILVYIDKMQAYCIPLRSFATPEQAERFYEGALAYWKAAHSGDAQEPVVGR